MNETYRYGLLAIAVLLIGGGIWWLSNYQKVMGTGSITKTSVASETKEDKAKKYPPAIELVPGGDFINSEPFALKDLIGKKIILLDFWTYSCINCQRTSPYLTSWYSKYKDQGFVIVGVHTPEFEFEKKYENVVAATKRFGIAYPVVQDNDYGTWRAYGNQYWPRHYLIDIDGYIVEDHIGEGGYEKTEAKIQELLAEKMARLGESGKVDMPLTKEIAVPRAGSPETYFGSLRNQYLGNGTPGKTGVASFAAPASPSANTLYLDGKWNIAPEYAENNGVAKIIYRYKAQNVYLVMSSEAGATAQILLDGKPINIPGIDVKNGKVNIKEERLYTLVSGKAVEEHILEIIIDTGSIKAYAFTFG